MKYLKCILLAGLGLSYWSGRTSADPVLVGSGPNTSNVVFDFPDGYVADYNVSYTAPLDVYDVTQIVLQDPNIALGWTVDPTYGAFLNQVTYTGGHGGADQVDVDGVDYDYWAEYINVGGAGWQYGEGASSDILNNGDSVGWVFGINPYGTTPVVPEPASLTLALPCLALLLKRKAK